MVSYTAENNLGNGWEKYKIPGMLIGLGILLLTIGLRIFFYKPASLVEFTEEKNPETLTKEFKIDVSGAVETPGVYVLSSGSRIQDALLSAGGLSDKADRKWVAKFLNLAGKLADGIKIYIPEAGEAGTNIDQSYNPQTLGSSTLITSKDIISINNASSGDLDKLPGIGPVTAKKIIDNRPYQNTEDLLTKKIIGKSTFEKIKPMITTY